MELSPEESITNAEIEMEGTTPFLDMGDIGNSFANTVDNF